VVYVGRTHSGCEVRKGAAGRHIYSGCEASKRVCRLLGMRLTLNQRKNRFVGFWFVETRIKYILNKIGY
jgi:hypothetical protein